MVHRNARYGFSKSRPIFPKKGLVLVRIFLKTKLCIIKLPNFTQWKIGYLWRFTPNFSFSACLQVMGKKHKKRLFFVFSGHFRSLKMSQLVIRVRQSAEILCYNEWLWHLECPKFSWHILEPLYKFYKILCFCWKICTNFDQQFWAL